MWTNQYITDDLRRIMREEAIKGDNTIPELKKEIKKYSMLAYTEGVMAVVSEISGLAGMIYLGSNNRIVLASLVALTGAGLAGTLIGMGKVTAMKADALQLAKENLEGKIVVQ
jgi:hypothetical protein